MASKSLYSKISVGVVARVSPFLKALRKLRKRLDKIGKRFKSLGKAAGVFAGAAAAGMAVLVRNSMGTIDSLAKTADKLGIATNKLQAYRHAAELSGVSGDNFSTALQRMVRRISEVGATGKGTAAPALKEMGLNIENLKRLSPDQQFAAIAEKMNGVASQSDRVRLAFALFDSEGVGLVNMLKMGKAGLDDVEKGFQATGLAISRVDAAQVEMANDAIANLQAVIKGVIDKIAVEMAPHITVMTDWIRNAGSEGFNFGQIISNAFDTILDYAAPVAALFNGISMAWSGIRGLVATIMGNILKGIQKLIDGVSWVLEKFGVEFKSDFVGILGDAMVDEGVQSFVATGQKFDRIMSGQVDRTINQYRSAVRQVEQTAEATAAAVEKQIQPVLDQVKEAGQEISMTERAALATSGSEAAWRIMRDSQSGDAKLLSENKKQTRLFERIAAIMRRVENNLQPETVSV